MNSENELSKQDRTGRVRKDRTGQDRGCVPRDLLYAMRSDSCLTPRIATIRSSVSAPCTLASST
jgi:hypothetical protein